MRPVDVQECRAFGHHPKQALRESLLASSKAFTALVDDRPEAMFGLVVNSALTGEGAPWFLGTDVVWRHARALLIFGPSLLAHFHDSTARLSGLVSGDNAAAIRLLRRWGFSVSADMSMVGGVGFCAFARTMER
jgi:hypothetical protein